MSRKRIFEAIEKSHAKAASSLGLAATTMDERRRAAAERIANPPRHLQPQRSSIPPGELPALFKSEAERQLATVVDVQSASEIPQAIAGYLKANNVPPRIRMGQDAFLAGLPWNTATGLARDNGPATPTDLAGLSRAVAGIAETGTLVLCSGPDNPVTLNFLPETHIVVLRRADILASYEDAFDHVRASASSTPDMPRTLNLITGPSRTADIGGKIVIGAHGARRVAIVLLNEG